VNYRRGRDIEYKAVELLRECDFTVARSAGSHGPWDISAVGPSGVRFIQTKRAKKDKIWLPDYMQAKEQLATLPVFPMVTYEIWVWVDRKGWVAQDVVNKTKEDEQ